MKFFINSFFILSMLAVNFSCSQEKINGVNTTAPPQKPTSAEFINIKKLNANWLSVIPYGYSKDYTPNINFNTDKQWWGEKIIGVKGTIKLAKEQGLKVMLKPHLWFGWNKSATEFNLNTEKDWLNWEKSYTTYIIAFAKIAQQQQVDLFCFSTELKQVVLKRPLFFKRLIQNIKTVYKGKLTYAANWDNYQNVTFWTDIDYIGVDAYFPLSEDKTPSVIELNEKWQPIKQNLKKLSIQLDKPVLFTEYGFESCDFNTKETWGSHNKYPANEQAQINAYQSFYTSFYNEKWFAGGFIWKWHLTQRTMRNTATSFTPQGKKVEFLIQKTFDKY